MSDPLGLFAKEDPLGLFEGNDPLELFGKKKEKAGVVVGLKSAFANVGDMADTAMSTLAGSAAAMFGDKKEALDIQEQMMDRRKTRQEWANPDNQEIGFGGKLAGVAATLPMQIAGMGFSPAQTTDTLYNKGESAARSVGGGLIDAAGNAAGIAMAPAYGARAGMRLFTGAGMNAAQDYASKKAIQAVTTNKDSREAFEPSMEDAAIAGVIGGGFGVATTKRATTKNPKVNTALDEMLGKGAEKAKADAAIDNLKATEGLNGQRALFDIPESSRVLNKYEAVPGDWRIDENGMPIKADLSMDVANAENPLQRNMWGDELPKKHEQEADLSIPEAIDTMPKGPARDAAIARLSTSRFEEGDAALRTQGELDAAGLASEVMYGDGGGVLKPTPDLSGFTKPEAMENNGVVPEAPVAAPEPFKSELSAAYRNSGAFRKQAGFINPSLIGAGKVESMLRSVQKGVMGAKDFLTTFKGTFAASEITRARLLSESPDGESHIVMMRPGDFLKSAASRGSAFEMSVSPKKRTSVREGLDTAEGLRSIPKLEIDTDGNVIRHDGRHRMDVFGSKGLDAVPVIIEHFGVKNKDFAINSLKSEKSAVDVIKTPREVSLDNPLFTMKNDFRPTAEAPLERTLKAVGKNAEDFKAPADIDAEFNNLWNDLGLEDTQKHSYVQRPATKAEQAITRAQEKRQEKLSLPKGVRQKQGGFINLFGDKKDNATFLKGVPGIKDALGDIGHSNIETPEQALALTSKVKDVAQNVAQRSINALTKGGVYMKAKVNHPVVHFVVDTVMHGDNRTKAEKNAMLSNDYLPALRELTDSQFTQAFEFANAADLNKIKLDYDVMAKHGIETPIIEFLKKHEAAMEISLANMNAVRATQGKKPLTARPAYSSMGMTGDYRKVVYRAKLDADNNPVVNADGTIAREVVGVIGANATWGAGWTLAKLEKHLKKTNPDYEFGPQQEMKRGKAGQRGTSHDYVKEALTLLGEENPNMKQFLEDMGDAAKKDLSKYMGMEKHTMAKRGVFGMEGRKDWLSRDENAKAFFENQVNYIENAIAWKHHAEAATTVQKVLKDQNVIENHGNAAAIAEDYLANSMGLSTSKVGEAMHDVMNGMASAVGIGGSIPRDVIKGIKVVANTSMLSLNPSFLILQMVQLPSAMPAMTAFLAGRGLASKGDVLTAGAEHLTRGLNTLAKDTTGVGKMSAIETGAIKYARENHVYATDMVEHASQVRQGAGFVATKLTQSPAATIERGTRAQAFFTMVHMMDAAGLKVDDGLYKQAHRMTDMMMGHYSSLEKPAIYNAAGPLGTMAYNLKTFSHNEISRWAMYAREISRTGNPLPLLVQMSTTIALAGVMGLPFYSQWEALYDYINQQIGTPRSLTMDVMEMSESLGDKLGNQGHYALSHGMFSLAGADVSKRIGLGDVVSSNASDAAFAGGGKLADMVKGIYNAVNLNNEEGYKAAAIALAPSIIAQPLVANWYQEDGQAKSRDPNKEASTTAYVNDRDNALRKVGIAGINESVQKTKNFENNKMDMFYKDKQKDAIVRMSHDIRNGRDVSASIQKYVDNQGDPSNINQVIDRLIMQDSIPANERAILKAAASKAIGSMYGLERRLR